MMPVTHPADRRCLEGFDPGQNFIRQRRKGHRVDPIEIAGHLPNLAMIQTKSLILECEQDPVHPYSYRKVQSHPKTRPYAGQYRRSEEHTSELQSLIRNSYAVFCLKKKIDTHYTRYSYTSMLNELSNNHKNI